MTNYSSTELTLSGFLNTQEFFDGLNNALVKNQYQTVAQNYSFYLIGGGKKYLWQANIRGKFVYQGTVSL